MNTHKVSTSGRNRRDISFSGVSKSMIYYGRLDGCLHTQFSKFVFIISYIFFPRVLTLNKITALASTAVVWLSILNFRGETVSCTAWRLEHLSWCVVDFSIAIAGRQNNLLKKFKSLNNNSSRNSIEWNLDFLL